MHFSIILGIFSLLWTQFYAVFGCGILPQGPVTALSFTVRGFTLAPEMVYSESAVAHTRIPAISRNVQSARRFLDNLVMNAVIEVLEQQGRNAFLTDAVISLILQQLNVTINYTPLNCLTATTEAANAAMPKVDVNGCFIINGVVASVCTMMNCVHPMPNQVKPVPPEYMSFTGSLKTSNIVMANWSRQLWQNLLNRVHQRLTSGQFASFFNTATITINN